MSGRRRYSAAQERQFVEHLEGSLGSLGELIRFLDSHDGILRQDLPAGVPLLYSEIALLASLEGTRASIQQALSVKSGAVSKSGDAKNSAPGSS